MWWYQFTHPLSVKTHLNDYTTVCKQAKNTDSCNHIAHILAAHFGSVFKPPKRCYRGDIRILYVNLSVASMDSKFPNGGAMLKTHSIAWEWCRGKQYKRTKNTECF